MEAVGVQWLRQRFPWDLIEPEKGVFDWSDWDGLVLAVGQGGPKLVAVLDGAPAWARAAEDRANPLAPPKDARDFGNFARAFATRYGDQVDYYQIWDEPNITPHWGNREVDPAGYSHLLRDAAIQIRAIDPGAVILTAALAPNVELGGANMSDVLYLDALYRAGAAEWFDSVGAQPYDFGAPADSPPDPDQLNWRRVALLRDVMEAHGDEDSAVWAVSFGWSAPEPEELAAAVLSARSDWPWLGPMLWAAWSPQDLHGRYALTDLAGQPRLGYEGFRDLGELSDLAWPGVYAADHPSGKYEGGWRVSPFGADVAQSGDSLEVPFWGTRIDLTIRSGDYRAFLFVNVDGEPANALPKDENGRAFVVLYDPQGKTRTVTLAQGLSEGAHLARIVAERGWGQWPVVGWTVSREIRSTGMTWLAMVLSFSALVALGCVLVGAWSERQSLLSTCHLLVGRYRALDARLSLGLTVAAAVLVYIIPGTISSLLALGLLGFLLLLRPEMGLPVIAFALPLYQPGKLLLGKVFSMVEILCVLTAVGWVLGRLLALAGGWDSDLVAERAANKTRASDRLFRLRLHVSRLGAMDWGVLALLLLGASSLLWSEHVRVAAREFRTVILGAVLFYALLRVLTRTRQEIWRVADAWVLGAGLVALAAVLLWLLGRNVITVDGVWRARAFYGSPNNLALYLGRTLPVGVALAFWGREKRRRWTYGLAAVLMGLAITLSFSRGAWLLAVPASLLFLAAMRGRRAFVAAAGVLFAAAVLVLVLTGAGRLTSLLETEGGTTFLRVQLWRSSWAMIREHPVLGVGLDNFLYSYRSHYVLPSAWEEFNLSHPHNLLLDSWLRLGLGGILVLGWLLVGFYGRGLTAYRRLPEVDERLLVLGLMGGMVGAVAHGLVDHSFFLVDLAFAFVLMLALVQAVDASVPKKDLRGD
jgi:O-antigen ligase